MLQQLMPGERTCSPDPAHDEAGTAVPTETWPAWLWYEWIYATSMLASTLGFSMRREGARHIPSTGPALLIANHQSFLDPVLIGLAARRHLRYLARKTLFRNRFFRFLIESLNAVPIDQEGFAREGLKTMIHELRAGNAIIVYPEGERTPHGRMQPFRPGVSLLIKKVETPIIPIGIAGAYDAWPIWRNYPIPAPLFLPAGRGTIAVSIGKPFHSRDLAGLSREQMLDRLFAEVQAAQQRAERLRRKSRIETLRRISTLQSLA